MFRTVVIIEIFLLIVLIGQFILQYFLSTRRAKWPGLILPALCILFGGVYALNGTTVPAVISGFLLGGGLPCLLHLALYRLGRSRREKKDRDHIEKMNIQDL